MNTNSLWIVITTILSCFATDNRLSLTKGGNIRIGQCNFSAQLFEPLDTPLMWMSCEDANSYTWNNDFDGHLRKLSTLDRMKLSRSSGFCPHRRCQLPNVTNSGHTSTCPKNLCYTKVENGYPSFGACCFEDGSFDAGGVIGHYFKSQPTPKPIYKYNRVILGGDSNDTSYESFISANEVFPGLITAQCPLTGHPEGFANTIEDNKRMILERNVSLWVQIAPFSEDGEVPSPQWLRQHHPSKYCEVFPMQYFQGGPRAESSHAQGISDFSFEHVSESRLYRMNYTLTGYTSTAGIDDSTPVGVRTVFASPCSATNPIGLCDGEEENWCVDMSGNRWDRKTVRVHHLWLYKWDDFSIPDRSIWQTVADVADLAAAVLQGGTSCVVQCFSGRGRSGTLAAIVAAKVRGIKAVSKIVDLIVEMRRSRDGLVETPQQMEFVLNVISLDKGKRKRPVSISPAIVPGTPRPWYRQVWVQHLSGVVILLIIVFVVSYFLDLGDPAAATARRSLVNLHCDPTASSSRNTVGRTGAAVDINMKNKCS